MKKIVLLLLLITGFAYGNLSAQTGKVPAEVTNAFKAKYPDAQNVEWKSENSDFLANFTLKGLQKTAKFSSTGEWQEIDTKMSFDSIPDVVEDGFKKSRFSDWTPGAVTYVDNSKTQWYNIEVQKDSEKKFLYFNGQGLLIMVRGIP